MSKFTKFIRRYWLPLWCILSAVSILGMFVSAEYELANSNSSMKRVVASTSDKGKMFSSNLLVEGTDPYTYAPKYFQTLDPSDQATSTYDVDVFLWNYSLGDITQKYPEDIKYTISLAFSDATGVPTSYVDSDGDDKTDVIGSRTVKVYRVTNENVSPVSTELVATLDGTAAGLSFSTPGSSDNYPVISTDEEQHHYVLKFSGDWDLESDTNICVRMTATPYKGGDESKYRDISQLAAVIGLGKKHANEEIITTGWEAYIAEKAPYGNQEAEECSAYNLVVTGSGKKKITIKWDSSVFECNKYFCNYGTYGLYSFATGEVTYDQATSTIVIIADSSDEDRNYRNRYDIQFYKKDVSALSNWDFFSNNGGEIGTKIKLSVAVEDIA